MALAFAAEKHRHQRRKDAAASPYINHPIAVATALAVEGGVTDDVILLAACLHDTVEDTETTFEELEETFGRKFLILREMSPTTSPSTKQLGNSFRLSTQPSRRIR